VILTAAQMCDLKWMGGKDSPVVQATLNRWYDKVLSKLPDALNAAVYSKVEDNAPQRTGRGELRSLLSASYFLLYDGMRQWPSLPSGQKNALMAVSALSSSMGKAVDSRAGVIPDHADYQISDEVLEDVAHWVGTSLSISIAKGWMEATKHHAADMLKVMQGSEGCPNIGKADAEKYLRMTARTRLKSNPMILPHGNHASVILERVVYR